MKSVDEASMFRTAQPSSKKKKKKKNGEMERFNAEFLYRHQDLWQNAWRFL